MRQTSLPLENLQAWSRFNNVRLFDVAVEAHIIADNGDDHGGGLLSKAEHTEAQPLVAVPIELVLSKERVEEAAKVDKSLKELIEAVPTLVQNDRTAVLLFLVYQMTINSPDNNDHALGVNNPFADYVKFLPKDIPLPISYTADERELLIGTSLAEALDQKLISLQREFDSLKAATETIPWCEQAWWDEITGSLDFADWKLADAVYRSRALELPRGASVGMVPVVDMANHASDDRYNARFEVDEDTGSVLLVVRDGKSVKKGDEVTIMYGCGGACEMIFSYGFLEEHARSAREMFLGLSIPADDPLRKAKIWVAQAAPGVRIYVDDADQVRWDSTFVWWACINQEDGLEFRVERTVDGDTELKALWRDSELDPNTLQAKLLEDYLRDVFVLRGTVMVQQRVEEQGMRLAASEDEYDNALPNTQIRPFVYETVGRLRKLEMDLLTRTYEALEEQKNRLLESPVVREYLGQNRSGTEVRDSPEDFS
ncbi:hypothetical protein LTR10_024189 [Elasticomyces elasticus]|uniref:SET domain-containing protein n=1 Tax=Exophiala sideris TaxID=1016849 RepID=A0ABR0JPQ6_9EURO|nr:hypothetical protein LTR10_024189 [Elasticomyces elasticus]KAK5039584.1 hypothetical protein LTS07_000078 [Exophiala sideris]KAK5041136.1 hypothetical protein LTR13_002610 [Exophiala sideris]KAK5067961.1 hypothetical protein LTR69_000078 [Exophiala sideris]KAK5187263.1 hypothetical protein LTR44_000078 [Eurotiomycetes sp. CCFEE 6388]